MAHRRRLVGLITVWTLALGAAWAAALTSERDWAFPGLGTISPKTAPANQVVGVPGSTTRKARARIADGTAAVDWRPAEHPPLPPAVARGAAGAYACGYCHLPSGEGRPENASLAGLPAQYISRQVAAFASGERVGMHPDWGPVSLMIQTAKSSNPKDVAAAARYFSARPFVARVTVVEVVATPAVTARGYVYARQAGPPVPIGRKIVETPVSFERFERRDPHVGYIAYVPAGAVARGAALVASGGAEGQPCAMCHGGAYRGGLGPPLAGRSPTGMVRQLMAFKSSARRGADASAMAAVATPLSEGQMIDLAAYLASRRP